MGFPVGASSKEPACQCRGHKRHKIPGSGRSSEGGHENPLQYSCLKNPMDRGVGRVTVHSVTKRYDWSNWACIHASGCERHQFNRVFGLGWHLLGRKTQKNFLFCRYSVPWECRLTLICPDSVVVRNSPASAWETKDASFNPWVRKIPWSRKWQSIPVFLSAESHGQGSLAGYSPRGLKDLNMTEYGYKQAKPISKLIKLKNVWIRNAHFALSNLSNLKIFFKWVGETINNT